MLDHITNDLFKVVVAVVEFYTTILGTSTKLLSVGDIDKKQIRNE
jgi:hypothetical protein